MYTSYGWFRIGGHPGRNRSKHGFKVEDEVRIRVWVPFAVLKNSQRQDS